MSLGETPHKIAKISKWQTRRKFSFILLCHFGKGFCRLESVLSVYNKIFGVVLPALLLSVARSEPLSFFIPVIKFQMMQKKKFFTFLIFVTGSHRPHAPFDLFLFSFTALVHSHVIFIPFRDGIGKSNDYEFTCPLVTPKFSEPRILLLL